MEGLKRQMQLLSPMGRLNEKRQYAMHLEDRLQQTMRRRLDGFDGRMRLLAERLEGMSPLKKLAQGYAYVADESGHCLSSIKGVAIGDPVQVYVRDGRMQAVIKEIDEDVAWKKKN